MQTNNTVHQCHLLVFSLINRNDPTISSLSPHSSNLTTYKWFIFISYHSYRDATSTTTHMGNMLDPHGEYVGPTWGICWTHMGNMLDPHGKYVGSDLTTAAGVDMFYLSDIMTIHVGRYVPSDKYRPLLWWEVCSIQLT
jgi:hypothetical protein